MSDRYEPLERLGGRALGGVSRLLWDLFYEMEPPVTRPRLNDALYDRLLRQPGLSGHVLRLYVRQHQDRKPPPTDDGDGFSVVVRRRAARAQVTVWTSRNRAAGYLTESDGVWTSTGRYPKVQHPETGRLVEYTPELSAEWQKDRLSQHIHQGSMMAANRLTENLTVEEVEALLVLLATRTYPAAGVDAARRKELAKIARGVTYAHPGALIKALVDHLTLDNET